VSLTGPLFFLLPRTSNGVVRGFGGGEAFTGFSNSMTLGEVARIRESSQLVMRIKLDRSPGRRLKWMGIALDHFNGTGWIRREGTVDQGKELLIPGHSFRDDEFVREFLVDPRQAVSPIRQQIALEPLGIETIFGAARVSRISAPIGRLESILHNGGLLTPMPRPRRLSYSVLSDIRIPRAEELRGDSSAHYTEAFAALYLQLPGDKKRETPIDPRISDLARQITSGQTNTYDKASAIESYLKNSFGYTLDLGESGSDPLAEFLFDKRTGHCEYFATAMAVMSRTIGIPSRVVNGFQMGEFNEISDFYSVRQHDAHSWVEVYFGDLDTWVEFDPTPAAGVTDYSQGGIFTKFKKYLEAAEVFWMDYVVTLGSDRQAEIMVGLQRRLISIKNSALRGYAAAKNWIRQSIASILIDRRWSKAEGFGILLFGFFLVIVGFSVYVVISHFKLSRVPATGYVPWWKRLFVLPTWRRLIRSKQDHSASAVLFYEQMLAALARAGRIKKPYQTPIEFASECNIAEVEVITDCYNRVRFGGARLTENDASGIQKALAQLKLLARHRPKAAKRPHPHEHWQE
jgi:hypothetical protein